MESQSQDNYLPYSTPLFSFISFTDRTPYLSLPIDYHEHPSRSPKLCRELEQTLVNPVAGPALSLTCDFVLSSAEGDEFGIQVASDPHTPASPRSSARVVKMVSHLLSGFELDDYWRICWRMLAWGDAFASVVENPNGSLRFILLPTWQIHLEVDEFTGELTKVYQLRPGDSAKREIDLESFCHWSYRKGFVYGRSIYYEVRDAVESYKRNSEDISDSSRSAAIVPSIHIMPEGASSEYLQAYKTDHQHQQKQSIVSDIYIPFGADVKKPFGGVQQFPLSAMKEAIQFRRLEIAVASRVPLYLLGIEYKSAREISLQPAMTFRLHIGRVRSILAVGLKKCIDRHLKKQGFPPPYSYQLIFPKIDLNPFDIAAPPDDSTFIDTDG